MGITVCITVSVDWIQRLMIGSLNPNVALAISFHNVYAKSGLTLLNMYPYPSYGFRREAFIHES